MDVFENSGRDRPRARARRRRPARAARPGRTSAVRIDLLAPPYRGHLHPILAIGRELAARHDVRVISTPAAAADVRACGLAFAPLLDAAADVELAAIADPPRAVGGHPVRLWRQLRRTLDVLARARTALDALWANDADRPALVIADFTLPVAGPAAAARGIEWWTSLPSPCVLETASGPPAYLGGWARRDDALGHASATRSPGTPCARSSAVSGASSAFGSRRSGSTASTGATARRPRTRRCACSPSGSRRSSSAPAGRRRCASSARTCSDRCRRHIRRRSSTAGGTCSSRAARTSAGRRRRWVAPRPRSPGRFRTWKCTWSKGDPGATAGRSRPSIRLDVEPERRHPPRSPENLTRLAWVDYARHVRRYALVVHHAGAGILYRCLADGVPALAWPRDYDQFDNAARLERAGLARRIDRSDDLVGAVRGALADGELAGRCAAMAERLRQCSGAVSALVEVGERS